MFGWILENPVGVEAVMMLSEDHHCLTIHLGALSADTAGELDVLGHDGHTLGMDGAQVGVLE